MADVSLAWHRTLTSSLDKLRSDNTLCDTTIATSDGQSLTTHACVLAAASPVLQTALVKIAERCYLVNIAGITCQVWRLVLHFVYTGTLDTDCTSNVEDISAAAATLQLPLLLQIVETKQEKKKRIGEGGGGDFEVTLGGSGDRVELAQFVKNEARSDDVEYQLEPAGEKGGTDAGLKASVAGSNDEDDSCVQHRGDRSSELDVGGEVETSEVTDGNNDTVTSVDTATVLVPASDRTSSVQVKPSDGGTESTGIVTRTLRHECDICARRFRYRSALTIHARTHTEEKPYACVECGMKFGSRAVLKNHTYTHMTDRQIYQCDQCDKCFLTKSGLWQHRRSHRLRVGTAVTTCTICDKRLDSLDELREHLVTEHNRKMFACIECHKMFESEAALSAHTATHAGEKEFICNICGQSFDQFNALKCHQRLHAGQKRYSCEECGARFQTKCGYKAHMKRHSSSQEKFLCTCGKVYTTLRGLHNHRQHHHKDGESDKKPTCSICQSEFETSADLNEHKASEHRRRYLCGECGNTFSTPGALLRHTLIHTGEKPFACMTCGRAFRTRGTLVAHERCHTGEKPFPCPTCGARFRIRNALTIHKRIHTGERPYECAVCAARFRSRTLQMAHQQRHHVPASERKHVCSKCGKIFLSRSTLREHEQRNHADDPSVDEMRRCVCTLCGKVVAHAASLRSHMYVHVKKKLFQCIQCESAFRRNSDLKRHLRQVHGYEVVPDAATVTESPSESSHVICEPVLEQEHLSEATIVFTANL